MEIQYFLLMIFLHGADGNVALTSPELDSAFQTPISGEVCAERRAAYLAQYTGPAGTISVVCDPAAVITLVPPSR